MNRVPGSGFGVWGARIGKRSVILAVALALPALLSVELAVRARLYLNSGLCFKEEGLFQYRPHTQVGDRPERTTNNLGFFGTDLSHPKNPGTYRVFLLGASTIASPLTPTLIHEKLAALVPEASVEVNSTGVPRYTSHHLRLLFEHELLPLQPDCILVYLGLNDNVYDTHPHLSGEPPSGVFDHADPWRSIAWDALRYYTLGKRKGVTPDFTGTRSQEVFEANLRHILQLTQTHGVRAALVKMAVGYPTDDPFLVAAIRNAEGPMQHYWGTLDAALSALSGQWAACDRLGAEFAVPVGDPSPVLPKTHEYFADLGHFTPTGHERFAAYAADLIKDCMRRAP